MLAAASLMLVGGERLARQEVETRIPAERERLLDFADKLDTELERLDQLYNDHLNRIADNFVTGKDNDLAAQGDRIHGILSIHHFALGKNPNNYPLTPPGPDSPRLPEIIIEGKQTALNPNNAVTLPEDPFETQINNQSGWLAAPNPDHQVYFTKPTDSHTFAFVIDHRLVRTIANNHLTTWMEQPLAPLRESDSLFAITTPDHTLATPTETNPGPAALIMPFRTDLGTWEIRAWDRVTTSTTHNTATLAAAAALATILTLSGLILWHQQRRALQLAEERVSFVNRVSHELGTPLTNLALNVDLATDSLETQPSETKHRLAIVTEEIERLGRLVANVLTFSRREKHTLQLNPQACNPDEVISKTIDSFRPALQRREITIDWTPNAATRTSLDPDALGQIVGNLISNVEKYAADGKWIGITSSLATEHLTIRIADRGPGIPKSSQEKIFNPFERVHRKVNEGSSGTGLGLTIARELATRMDGKLSLLPTDSGTCFELQLPAPENLKLVSKDGSSAA